MNKLEEKELYEINGGATFLESLKGTVINSLVSTGKLIYQLGQNLGSSIRRIIGGNICKI